MDEIKLSINNPNNKTYKSILMRKFFLMLFIDADGKKIHAYIATVFGGLQKNLSTDQSPRDLEKLLPVSHVQDDPCYLMFQFSSDSIIDRISFEDKTDSFCNQTEWINKVWGKSECCSDKSQLDNSLRRLYADNYNGQLPSKVDSGAPVYSFSERNRPLHSFLAAKGRYEQASDNPDDGYRLYAPMEHQNTVGIEAVNWIKANISLKVDVRNRPIAFSIVFGDNKIYTPDFTWYLAPPAGYVVGGESSVKVGDIKDKNAISAVSDETDVLFKEWKEERIVERKKSRILFGTIPDCNARNLSNHEKLTVYLHVSNPQGPTNRQFVIGLLIAFLLSFCSDKTRINDYYSCLLNYCTCADKVEDFCSKCSFICNAISVFSPILVLMAFLVWVLNPKRCFPPGRSNFENRVQTGFKICHFIGILLTVILVIYVFVIWLLWPGVLGAIGCSWNSTILTAVFLVAAIVNIAYLLYCLMYLKRNIINYL